MSPKPEEDPEDYVVKDIAEVYVALLDMKFVFPEPSEDLVVFTLKPDNTHVLDLSRLTFENPCRVWLENVKKVSTLYYEEDQDFETTE